MSIIHGTVAVLQIIICMCVYINYTYTYTPGLEKRFSGTASEVKMGFNVFFLAVLVPDSI